jgi:hypothetical protein
VAWPSSPTLDAFNRANEAPIGPPWESPGVYSTDQPLNLDTNALVRPGGGYGSGFLAGPYGNPDVEVWAVVKTPGSGTDGMELAAKLRNGDTLVPDMYFVHINGPGGTWQFWKSVSGVQSSIGATFAGVGSMATGDMFGYDIIGNDLTAYFKPSAGPVQTLFTRTDATWAGQNGGIGFLFQQTNWAIDEVGGGAPGSSTPTTGYIATPYPPAIYGRGAA